ncbi:MAG: CDP-alcohol phosphatidyltransferase family protein [Myxococcota bacterium]|nr:CDP-alcohol phosphatidyltransferase family protein [Myxococcota bacterium]
MNKLKYLVPNSLTAFSMLLGLISTYYSTQGHYDLAAWMILWGVLLDKLDGTSARLLNASSKFGAELDSFADFVTFGVATAFLLLFSLRELDLVHPGWILASSGVYVVAVAVRLARFNVVKLPLQDKMFYGIPTTVMGGLLATWYLTWGELGLSEEWMAPIPFVLLICSFAMISNIRFPKIQATKSMPLNLILFACVLTCYTLVPLQMHPEIIMAITSSLTLFGVVFYAVNPPTADPEFEEEEEVKPQPSF